MALKRDAFECGDHKCTNLKLKPKPKSTQFAYSVSLYKYEQIQACGFCVFSFKIPLGFLTIGIMTSVKGSGVNFVKQY